MVGVLQTCIKPSLGQDTYILTKCEPVVEAGKSKWKLTANDMYQGPLLKEWILEGWLVENLIQKSQEISNILQQINPTYGHGF